MVNDDFWGITGNNFRGNSSLKRTGAQIQWTPELISEFVKCRDDPIYFTETYFKIITIDHGMVPFILYDYQKEMMMAMKDERFTAFCMARQSGKSVTICAFLLWFAIFNKEKTIAILANKQDTALEILGRIRTAYQHLPKWLAQGIIEWNKGSIVLENGSRILASATSSDNIRGYSVAICYIDEAAFVEKFDEFFKSVYPTISSGKTSKIIQTSTPNGLNHFYKTIEMGKRGENGYYVMEVPWYRVPGRDEDWKAQTLKAINFDMEQFNQEFDIQWLGSSGTLIAGWKLKELVFKQPVFEKDNLSQYKKPVPEHRYAIVADVSRGKGLDYSAFSVLDITSMPYDQVAVYRSNMILPMDYAEIVHNIAKLYNEALVLVEINDLGGQVADVLFYEFEYINLVQTENAGAKGKRISQGFSGKTMERGVRTTKTVKNTGCSILKILIEQNQLVINDADTIQELSTFSRKNQSYEAEPGNNDDIVMGLVLFSWMTDQNFFREYSDINTMALLREKTDEEIMNDLTPFGFIDDGHSEEPDLSILTG